MDPTLYPIPAAGHPLPEADPGSVARAARVAGGYAWWYVDALTETGDGLVCIFFVGSPFSPGYAARLRRGEPALPEEHTAVNLALYRGGRQVAWVMSEHRGAGALDEAGV